MQMGMAMASKRKRAIQVPVVPLWAQEQPIDPRLVDERGITPERERQSRGDSEWGRDERKRQTVRTMRDEPLERLRGRLTRQQYDAAVKYRKHWYCAGLSAPLQSIDPNRVFASDVTNFSGMAKTEAQATHRAKYRLAANDIIEKSGAIALAVLETVVCHERPLSDVGAQVGFKSKPKGIGAAEEILKDALDLLCRHWGI